MKEREADGRYDRFVEKKVAEAKLEVEVKMRKEFHNSKVADAEGELRK